MKKQLVAKYRLLILSIKLILFLILAVLAYHFWAKPQGNTSFYIPESSTQALYHTLENNNYTMFPMDILFFPFITLPQKGWYHITKPIDGRLTFFSNLHTYKTVSQKIKIYAGETAAELSERLAKNLDLNATKLLSIYKKYTHFGEGDIISGEYTLGRDIDEKSTIHYLFESSLAKIKAFEKKYDTQITNNPFRYRMLVTIASIIQKESNAIKEMPLISSVIYNRLEKNMRLQMDGTLNYGKYSHKIINHDRIKTDVSEYNTYKYKGLPPTPLCTISIDALKAAYLPETTEYLFFMLNKDGTHNFESSYKKHLENIRAFKNPKKSSLTQQESNTTILTPLVTKNDTNISEE